ncbi:hypothetical protein FCE86_031885 [Pseudomonas chlororaphis subsp. aureofaciens]|nr:hypothetical protein F7R16_10905 [Pseudomonas chlororaphis subsp. aureofaciens]TSD26063.1 hypothetical protein FCE86_031885 [Pseudomonas sp. ATCC 13985]
MMVIPVVALRLGPVDDDLVSDLRLDVINAAMTIDIVIRDFIGHGAAKLTQCDHADRKIL